MTDDNSNRNIDIESVSPAVVYPAQPPGSRSCGSADFRGVAVRGAGAPAAIRLFAAALLLAALPLPTAAITIPTYRASAGAGLDNQTVEDGAGACARASGSYFNTAAAEGSAKADGLGLGAGGRAAVPPRTLDDDFDGVWDPASIGGGGSARLRIDDLVFTRDDPTDTRPVTVATLLPIDGVFSFSRPEGSNSRVTASVGVDYGLGVPGVGSTAIAKSIGSILYSETSNIEQSGQSAEQGDPRARLYFSQKVDRR